MMQPQSVNNIQSTGNKHECQLKMNNVFLKINRIFLNLEQSITNVDNQLPLTSTQTSSSNSAGNEGDQNMNGK